METFEIDRGGRYNSSSSSSYVHTFAEVAAVPSRPRPGQHVFLGPLREDGRGQQAVKKAITFVKTSLRVLTDKFGPPKVSLTDCVRYRANGTPFSDKEWGYVNIMFHCPSHCVVPSLAPAFVLALVGTLWRLPCLDGVSAMGGMSIDGSLQGYHQPLELTCLTRCLDAKFHTILVAPSMAEELTKIAERLHCHQPGGVGCEDRALCQCDGHDQRCLCEPDELRLVTRVVLARLIGDWLRRGRATTLFDRLPGLLG